MTVSTEKERLRRELLARRRGLSASERARQSDLIAKQLFALPAWRDAEAVGLYASLPDEVATDAIIARAVQEGKVVALPAQGQGGDELRVSSYELREMTKSGEGIEGIAHDSLRQAQGDIQMTSTGIAGVEPSERSRVKPGMTRCIYFSRIISIAELVIGKYGVREPPIDAPIIPLSSLDLIIVPGVAFDMSGGRVGMGGGWYDRVLAGYTGVTIGLAFSEQMVGRVPRELHDIGVGLVLTPQG